MSVRDVALVIQACAALCLLVIVVHLLVEQSIRGSSVNRFAKGHYDAEMNRRKFFGMLLGASVVAAATPLIHAGSAKPAFRYPPPQLGERTVEYLNRCERLRQEHNTIQCEQEYQRRHPELYSPPWGSGGDEMN